MTIMYVMKATWMIFHFPRDEKALAILLTVTEANEVHQQVA